MLVYWIPNTPHTLLANASHRVAIGAFVMNHNREVLIVQESNGRFSGKGIWKFPTGAVNEGEDICTAAIREVKEETGIETEFVEVLAFRWHAPRPLMHPVHLGEAQGVPRGKHPKRFLNSILTASRTSSPLKPTLLLRGATSSRSTWSFLGRTSMRSLELRSRGGDGSDSSQGHLF